MRRFSCKTNTLFEDCAKCVSLCPNGTLNCFKVAQYYVICFSVNSIKKNLFYLKKIRDQNKKNL